jgi:hypothetical protein
MTARAKWDAWHAAGTKYNASADSENRYLEIARTLGWSESVVANEPTASADVDLEHLSDGEDPPATTTAAAGLGLSVSRMPRPDVAPDKTLHGMALACDLPGLLSLLDGVPNPDLNALDEYVSLSRLGQTPSTASSLSRDTLLFISHVTEVIWR